MTMANVTPIAVASVKEAKPMPRVITLQTPVSASYPSEIRSPMPGTPAYIKKEDEIKTPITPPDAYLKFLRTMSPALMSPAPTGTASHFDFVGQVPEKADKDADHKVPEIAVVQPHLSRTVSADLAVTVATSATDDTDGSDVSFESTSSTKRERSPEAESGNPKNHNKAIDLCKSRGHFSDKKSKPASPRLVIPPAPFARPTSARLSRRCQLPGSPLSPANVRSPLSARSHYEPRSASCLSATPWSASFTPTEDDSACKTSKVCVRHVVTRTVTYSQTPLDPAPKGKRRKVEE